MGDVRPRAYLYRYADPSTGVPIWRRKDGLWNGQYPFETEALYSASDYATLQARVAELEAERDAAKEDAACAYDTLNAWFDRRKLGHQAVDQAVLDAASGYLRTSRNGGMPQEESDLILGVIEDMARLSLFADLFARAALAVIQEDRE